MLSTDAALQRVKGIKKSFDNGFQNRLEQYMEIPIIDFYSTSEISEIFTSTEDLSGSRELAELETPPTLTLQDGYSVTISEKRFGGGILLPETVYKREGRDTTWKVDEFLKRQRDQLLRDNMNLLLTNAHAMLNEAFSNTSAYLAPDAVEICGTHNWRTGTTFANATTAKLSTDAIDTLEEYGGAFTSPSGKPVPLDFDVIVVKKGSANERMAIKLFAENIKPTALADINIYEGTKKIVATPYITYANRNFWFALSSYYPTPLAVGLGIKPTLNEPIRENNEALRTNCTGFWKQGVINMPFNIYGSDGTV